MLTKKKISKCIWYSNKIKRDYKKGTINSNIHEKLYIIYGNVRSILIIGNKRIHNNFSQNGPAVITFSETL